MSVPYTPTHLVLSVKVKEPVKLLNYTKIVDTPKVTSVGKVIVFVSVAVVGTSIKISENGILLRFIDV